MEERNRLWWKRGLREAREISLWRGQRIGWWGAERMGGWRANRIRAARWKDSLLTRGG